MKKFLFFICTIITLPIYASESVKSVKKKRTPASHQLPKRIDKTTKAQLYKEIAQLKRSRNKVDEQAQEEARGVREQLEQVEHESAEKTVVIAQRELSILQLKGELHKSQKQVEAHTKSIIAQHAVLEFQDGKLKNKRTQIAQLQARIKALDQKVKELTEKKQLERSPSLLAMYA